MRYKPGAPDWVPKMLLRTGSLLAAIVQSSLLNLSVFVQNAVSLKIISGLASAPFMLSALELETDLPFTVMPDQA